MREAIVAIIAVCLIAAGAPAKAQVGFTLPFGDSGSGGGLWIGGGGGSAKSEGGKPNGGPPGAKLSEPKSPLKTPQFKPDALKAPTTNFAKPTPKIDLGKTTPPAGLRKDELGEKLRRANAPADTPKAAAGADAKSSGKPLDKTTDPAGGDKANGKPDGGAKTPDQTARGSPRQPDRRRDDAPKGVDKPDTGLTVDGGPVDPRDKVEDSGGAIVEAGPPSRPVKYVAPLPNALCGPDVTEQVLAILRDMADQFHAHPEKQGEACRKLVSPFSGGQAWDINGLDPETGGTPGRYEPPPPSSDWGSWIADQFGGLASPFRPKGKWVPGTPGTWLTRISDACAIPRPYPVCAATVEFLGTCQHAQIVNYAMWGMVMGLCDESGTGATHALGNFWRGARNLLGRGGTPPDQELMVRVGERYHDLARGAGGGPPPDTEELANWLQFEDERANHPERACPLHCPLTELQQRKIKVAIHGFDWDGLTR